MMVLYIHRQYKLVLLIVGLLIKFSLVLGQGEPETTTLTLANYRGSIQWEQSFDKVTWNPIAGGNVSQLSVGVTKTTYFRAKVTEDKCAPVYSNRKAVFVDNLFRIAATSVSGKIILPANTSMDWSKYDVRSVIDSSKVLAGGVFNVFATDSTKEDLLMVMDRTNNSVLMMGYFLGRQDSYDISAETTAIALLMMNPYAEIVSDDKKQKLIDAYKGSTEFKVLLTEVEKSIAGKKSLLDPTNIALREAIGRFGGKDFTSGKFSFVDPFYTENKEKSALVENRSSSVSYSGIIVKKGSTQPIEKFFLAGSLLMGSDYLKIRNALGSGLANAKPGFTYDFSKQEPGEYEIILSNGLNFSSGLEDQQALQENAGLLAYAFIDKLLPVSEVIKETFGTSDCFKALASLLESKMKIYFQAKAGNVKPEWYVDVLVEFNKGLIEIVDHNKGCMLNENTREVFRAVFRLYDMYDKVKKAYELSGTIARFGYDYFQYPSVDTLCKFVDSQDNMVYNCFTLQKIADGDAQKGYVCDTLPKSLFVQLVEDKKYYPDADPVEGFTVVWQKPDKSFVSSKTNYNGYAELKDVVLIDQPGEQTTSARIVRLGSNQGILQQVDFKATALRPTLQVQTANVVQTGEVGKKLTKPILLTLVDGSPIKPVKMSLFDIKPIITGGGTIEADLSLSTPLSLGWNWTLGPNEGEQSITFTISNKSCSPWQIQGNPVTFKATAVDLLVKKIQITPDNPTVKIDGTIDLKAIAYNSNNKEVPSDSVQWKWEEDGKGIVSITGNRNNAVVKGLVSGKATVTATETISGVKAFVNLLVVSDPTKLLIEAGNNQFRNTAGYLKDNLKVKLTDDSDTPFAGITLKWEISSGKGKLDYATTTTDANGFSENKFFVDYANSQHDVKVSVIGMEEINVKFAETLRLIPFGEGNTWVFDKEDTHLGEELYPTDEEYTLKLSAYQTACHRSKTVWRTDGKVSDSGFQCFQDSYYDVNQTDFQFSWNFGDGYTPNLIYKHYFQNGDTIYKENILVDVSVGEGVQKKMAKKFMIASLINERDVVLEFYKPMQVTSPEGIRFYGWNLTRYFIKRGVGYTKIESYNNVDFNWQNPPSTDIPVVPSANECSFSNLKLTDNTITDY